MNRPSRFVLAQALEDRLSHSPIGRPLLEAHLAHQARRNPLHRRIHLWLLVERACLLDQRVEFFAEASEFLVARTAAVMADVNEVRPVVDAQHPCPEMSSRAARRGKPADHRLLAVVGLDFEPLHAALPLTIGTFRVFRDDAFQPVPDRRAKEIDAAILDELTDGDIWDVTENRREKLLADTQWLVAQVAAFEEEQVEDAIDEPSFAGLAVVLARVESGPPSSSRATISPSSTTLWTSFFSDSTIEGNVRLNDF